MNIPYYNARSVTGSRAIPACNRQGIRKKPFCLSPSACILLHTFPAVRRISAPCALHASRPSLLRHGCIRDAFADMPDGDHAPHAAKSRITLPAPPLEANHRPRMNPRATHVVSLFLRRKSKQYPANRQKIISLFPILPKFLQVSWMQNRPAPLPGMPLTVVGGS